MRFTVSLYDLKPEASIEEHAKTMAEINDVYGEHLAERGQQYKGFYRGQLTQRTGDRNVSIDLPGQCAEITLLESGTLLEAAVREVNVPVSEAARDALNERLARIDPKRSIRLWLEPIGVTPNARDLDWRDMLVHMTFRLMPPGRTADQLQEFDHRIIGRYAEHIAQAKWHHVGTFHTLGLPEYVYVDSLDLVDATNIEEALSNDAANPTPPDIQKIYDECTLYADPSRERYQLWLKP